MKTSKILLFSLLFSLLSISLSKAQKPIISWSFDELEPGYTSVGKGSLVPGVLGQAFKFDGFSSYLEDTTLEQKEMARSFSIEAWLALGAYPWNWAPIVSIGRYRITGFYFGIDSRGRLGFQISDATSVWHSCLSDPDPDLKSNLGMPLHKWTHLVGTYSPENGMAVYVNGKLTGSYKQFDFKYGVRYSEWEKGFRLGMNREALAPTDPVRDWATWPSQYSLDGIIDEVKIYPKELNGKEVAELFGQQIPENEPDFASRDFPEVPVSNRFGANYTRMEFYPEWDQIWPYGEELDVAVQFDELPIKLMFWRGTRYSACWVSENNKWMADQSRETGYNWYLQDGSRDEMPTGCLEHMSDVQCRSSRVAIVENNPARVVVNWRYLQMDVQFRQKDLSDNTQFGEWGNELYYIYPDGVAVRKVLPGRGGWQESIFLNAPGTCPEDNVELEACTLINRDGESKTYSWADGYPKFDLKDANIQLINFKSTYKPFLILRDGGSFSVFNGEVRPEYSHFPWWNHWPVAQISSDGRSAYAPDRAAHSSLSWGNTDSDAALYGMTNQSKEFLINLSKSWNSPPVMSIYSKGFISKDYDFTQRAYVIQADSKSTDLSFELRGTTDSPIFNPAIVIKDWPGYEVKLEIDGKPVPGGKNFRQAIEYEINGSKTLILWIKQRASITSTYSLKAS